MLYYYMIDEEEFRKQLAFEVIKEGSAYAWARLNKVPRSVVSAVLREQMPVTPGLARALGYRRVVRFERIEE